MPFIIYTIIAIIAAIVLIGIIFFIYYLRQQKYNTFVLQNSVYLKQLNEINQRYNFYPYISFDQFHPYDN